MRVFIKYKEYKIKFDDLSEKTVNCLIENIKKLDANITDPITVFADSKKIVPGEDLEKYKINDKSRILVLVKNKKQEGSSGKVNNQKEKAGKPSTAPSAPSAGHDPSIAVPPYYNPNLFGGIGQLTPPGLELTPEMLKSVLNDPVLMENTINTMMPYANQEQKDAFRKQFEMVKNDPNLMKRALEQIKSMPPGVGQQGGFPGMQPNQNGIYPGMQPPQGGMYPGMQYPQNAIYPGMQYPQGGMYPGMQYPNLGMYSPTSPFPQGYPGYPPQYGGAYQNAQEQPPLKGPCSHGCYPPEIKDGKPSGQNAELLFSNQLSQLDEMGFSDREKNLKLLVRFSGDMDKVVEELTK